jgi:hypothetical protein
MGLEKKAYFTWANRSLSLASEMLPLASRPDVSWVRVAQERSKTRWRHVSIDHLVD